MVELAKWILNADSASVDDLRSGLKAGAEAVMGAYRPELLAALVELRQEFDFEVYPVVPNAPAYVRDLADLGMMGAALKRLRRLPLAAWLRLAAYGLANVRGVLAQDFGTMLGVMIQMELPIFSPFRPGVVFLHAQMTDLMLACGNAAGFRAFGSLVRGYGAEPGLETRNFGHLVPWLDKWRMNIPVIMATFNPQGFQMRPSREMCERFLKQTNRIVVAQNAWLQESAVFEEILKYVKSRNINAVVVNKAVRG
jgi:hypothetical protein